MIVSPHFTYSLCVQYAMSPHRIRFGPSDVIGLFEPTRLSVSQASVDGLSRTASSSSSPSSRMPDGSNTFSAILPASQNTAPPGVVMTPPIRGSDESRSSRPFTAALREDQRFTLPAPAAIRPPSVMYDEPVWSRSFTCWGVYPGLRWSSSAAPPLTTPADMLVPLRVIYALVGLPALWNAG